MAPRPVDTAAHCSVDATRCPSVALVAAIAGGEVHLVYVGRVCRDPTGHDLALAPVCALDRREAAEEFAARASVLASRLYRGDLVDDLEAGRIRAQLSELDPGWFEHILADGDRPEYSVVSVARVPGPPAPRPADGAADGG